MAFLYDNVLTLNYVIILHLLTFLHEFQNENNYQNNNQVIFHNLKASFKNDYQDYQF